jgi:predicted DNA-binding protein YlxM (UPF0122 family)
MARKRKYTDEQLVERRKQRVIAQENYEVALIKNHLDNEYELVKQVLSSRELQIFEMAVHLNMSFEEIVCKFNSSRNLIRNSIVRAFKKIREYKHFLQDEENKKIEKENKNIRMKLRYERLTMGKNIMLYNERGDKWNATIEEYKAVKKAGGWSEAMQSGGWKDHPHTKVNFTIKEELERQDEREHQRRIEIEERAKLQKIKKRRANNEEMKEIKKIAKKKRKERKNSK